jgi:hypothetical protein
MQWRWQWNDANTDDAEEFQSHFAIKTMLMSKIMVWWRERSKRFASDVDLVRPRTASFLSVTSSSYYGSKPILISNQNPNNLGQQACFP